MQFVTLAVIDSSLPAIGAPQPSKDKPEDEEPPLNLTIGITDEGFVISGSAPMLGCGQAGKATEEESCTQIELVSDGPYCQETQCGGADPGCRPDPACHNFKALAELVVQLKEVDANGDGTVDYEEEQNVIIAPNPDVKYSVLIGVMDATRNYKPEGSKTAKDLFPYVVIAGGVK